MLKISTFSFKGVKGEDFSLPKEFEAKDNPSLLAQAIRVYEERGHVGLSDTKTRAEINRTKKKWYKQKGTGGARHGARSAPIFVGGGVAHGPKPLRRILTLPGKLIKKALVQAMMVKVSAKEVVAVETIEKLNKTSEAQGLIKKIKEVLKLNSKRFTFVLANDNLKTKRCLRNIEGAKIIPFKDLNAKDVLFGGLVILDASVFAKAEKTEGKEVKSKVKKEETKKMVEIVKKGTKK